MHGSSAPKLACSRRHGRAGCEYVVHEYNARRRYSDRLESVPQIVPPFHTRKPTLPRLTRATAQKGPERDSPAMCELAGELRRRVVTSPQVPSRITGHEGDCLKILWPHRALHELSKHARQAALPALLPRAHESRRSRFVQNRAPSLPKRKPDARTLQTARHGPGCWRPATSTHRFPNSDERLQAGRAYSLFAGAADNAAKRQKEVAKDA